MLSAPYNYLVGTSTGLADHFGVVNKSYMARCGGMHVFHIRDLTRIAPLWLRFTERVSIRVRGRVRARVTLALTLTLTLTLTPLSLGGPLPRAHPLAIPLGA